MKVVNPEPFLQLNQSPTSILGVKLKMISEQILKRFDDDLYNHLFELKIEPQIYGIRWLRLLFGREFAFEDLLVVWDSIFADGISFGFCDYLFVSMLMTIRGLLLKSDFNNSLNLLMRFPQVNDIQYVIDLALFLRDPIVSLLLFFELNLLMNIIISIFRIIQNQ